MSDSDASPFAGFGKFVPGFDFLQNLATQAAGSAAQKLPQMPSLGNWVAPTLNVEELDKRITELKAVQFWLDQNAMALKATVQALEVQKMTLATLKGMNLSMTDMASAFKLKVADSLAGTSTPAAGTSAKDEKPGKTFAGFEVPPSSFGKPDNAKGASDAHENGADEQAGGTDPAAGSDEGGKPAAASGVVDPMQWWGALTQQFQTIAADAMKEAAQKSALNAGTGMAAGLAKDAMKSATDMAKGMADSAAQTASTTRAAMTSALRSTQAWPTPGAAKPPGAARKASSTSKAGTGTAASSKAKSKTSTAGKTASRTAAKSPRKASR